ncbi:hypothetical protein [Staphylococcus delphini]|uniref:hypothetical protein n=1 Tax=Staphylococcus delphini TaxID=53344 RepID=UPI0021CF854A|nr:hypothetical protein [Staphylococcus delphini]UXS36929.1 hypothetical protein MUA34_00265 [Staphylococcus delphini]UXS44399.1 hypothetical protein MUA39_00280 [Staphylococcus delphini]UXV45025.1 hypothetical protein MUA63_00275 [Staphylococcus delphini]
MNKILGILTTTALVATLAACSNGDNGQDKQENHSGKRNENQASQSQSNDNHSDKNSQTDGNTNKSAQKNQSEEEAIQNLTDEEKVALVLYEASVDPTIITADELASGEYKYQPMTHMSLEMRSVEQLTLTPKDTQTILPGAPSDFKVYGVSPIRVNAVPFIVVTNDQVIVFATQSPVTYDYVMNQEYTMVFDVKDLYSKHSNQDYKGLASKIVVGPTPAVDQGSSTSSSDSSDSDENESSSSSTTVTRANVIDLVEEYEGHQLDKDTYTYKEPEQLDDGSWGFSFLDKSGNLAGSYIVSEDGTVTKYDEKGIEE